MTDQAIRIFIAYAHEDDTSRDKLRRQLSVLERRGHFHIFWDGLIRPGERWDTRLKDELHRADIFLLLVSEAFLDSDYVNEVELPKALQLRAEGKAEVLPVILRRCLWQHTELNDFQCILCEGKPIETAPDGFAHVAEQVVETVNAIKAKRREAAQAKMDAEETERKRKEQTAAHAREEAARKKREADLASEIQRAKEAAQATNRDVDGSRQDDKKLDPFHDLMLPIKGGTFDMGDTFGDGFNQEKPVHRVTVSDFLLCKYPVTQAQWKQIMGNNPSRFKGDDLPVEQVSWDDAQAFLKALNKATNQAYRLPTEAEWEYAAREGGKKIRFGNGKDIADPKEMNFDASKEYKQTYSVVGEYRQKTTPVGQFKSNALGLHDMSGNVWEWCNDWYAAYPSSAQTNPTGPTEGANRVLRGGSWYYGADNCRAAYRYGIAPDNRFNDYGFRLASSPQ